MMPGTTARPDVSGLKTGNAVAESENIVAETAEKIFADLADAQTINRDKKGAWKAPLWQALTEAGLPLSWVPEDCGGSGASMAEGFGVLSAAGRFAHRGAARRNHAGGMAAVAGQDRLARRRDDGRACKPEGSHHARCRGTLSGRARGVPFAKAAKHIAVLAQRQRTGFRSRWSMPADAGSKPALNLGGDNSDTVTLRQGRARHRSSRRRRVSMHNSLLLMGGVARSLQIAGALESMLDISVRYSNERVAFEKKISKFQAVQHNLARLAGKSAAALAAATSAADAIANASRMERRAIPRSGIGQNPLLGGGRKRRRHRPSGSWRDRLHQSSTSCIAIRCGRWPGATISAPKATGRSNSASWSPTAAPTNCGRWWPRADINQNRLRK